MTELQASDLALGSWPATARHWRFPDLVHDSGIGDAAIRTKELLTQAVHSHLMSDVPVGIFLSSGIDSTIIASIAAGLSPDIHAFSVGFHDTFKESETAMAARTAAGLKLRHTSLWIDAEQGRHLADDWLRGLRPWIASPSEEAPLPNRYRSRQPSHALPARGEALADSNLDVVLHARLSVDDDRHI